MSNNIKVTVVGDGTVGKTCLLIAYTSKVFNEKYIPTVFDNYAEKIVVDDVEYNMAIWDTAGQEDYERLRPLSYSNTTCFLLCYSISQQSSYDNIAMKWAPEVRHYLPTARLILVGTKADLRNEDDPNLILLSEKDGHKMKKMIKAEEYFECSAKHMLGLNEIFVAAVRCSRKPHKPRRRECLIL